LRTEASNASALNSPRQASCSRTAAKSASLTQPTGFARSHPPQPDPLARWDAAVLDLLAENLLS
jgi:hypothetical protein